MIEIQGSFVLQEHFGIQIAARNAVQDVPTVVLLTRLHPKRSAHSAPTCAFSSSRLSPAFNTSKAAL